jgi:hypothetical protein
MFRPRVRFLGRRFFAFFALLAMFAQSVVAIAPLAEGRTARMSSHVEANGSASHFTHNEANCVACQARSLHAPAPATDHPPIADGHAMVARPRVATVIASADQYPPANPRAPPTLS